MIAVFKVDRKEYLRDWLRIVFASYHDASEFLIKPAVHDTMRILSKTTQVKWILDLSMT